MPGPHADLVAALADRPGSSPPAEELASALGRGVGEVWDELGRAEALGLVELWHDHPDGPAAVLSPLSAARLGLRLAGDGSRWLPIGVPDPPTFDPEWRRCLPESDLYDPDGGSPFLGRLADPRALDGPAIASASEDVERQARGHRACPAAKVRRAWRDPEAQRERLSVPEPTRILGLAHPWPVLIAMGEPCPGCRNARLRVTDYCALCHRSGVDHLLPTVPTPAATTRPVAPLAQRRAGKAKGRPARP